MSLSKKHKTTKIKTKSKKDNKISNIQKKKKVKDIRIDKILSDEAMKKKRRTLFPIIPF